LTEALRVNIEWKLAFLKGAGAMTVSAKFSCRRGRPSPTIFARLCSPVNALQLCRLQQNFVADFPSEVHFLWKTAVLRFLSHLRGLMGNGCCSS